MSTRGTPLLNREDPDKEPLTGNVKVTREDWLNLARDVLVHEGVGELKILGLSNRLAVSRSSFYWYFKDRADLLDALLDEWEARNTRTIVEYCARPADCINAAVCNFFRCFIDPALFDQGLDFAVREWARRDGSLRLRIDRADAARLEAAQAMFVRYGYEKSDADTRARILYFMQLGYHALEVREPMELRMGRLEGFLRGFTGQDAQPDIIAEFAAYALAMDARS
ncbi:transcriptional regulator, TetR family [Cribrihabitans marinus]|uniref:Transcriptional regulator, TetR family n=1 Tax=Cribrihabitans marinus TaxID=1227549 RepID=A0A1H6QDI0_9RHOB|nr:TetR/AcrR family transcriptional regulator [Cribrihabitans marinus]GGH18199.1 TetR family transcriptional regulator [Cribrihabitans marinus]SEI39926.1 transcriptional regulator, TetR family [Cribrihabitans marinus]